MHRASQVRIMHYDIDELSLKRQTIREDGAQSHGSLLCLIGTAKMAGSPAPKEES